MNDFKRWSALMGFNRKQVRECCRLIGITGPTSASMISTGKRELKETERLAMSALRLGLKPWTPDYDDELQLLAGRVARPIEDEKTPCRDNQAAPRPHRETKVASL